VTEAGYRQLAVTDDLPDSPSMQPSYDSMAFLLLRRLALLTSLTRRDWCVWLLSSENAT